MNWNDIQEQLQRGAKLVFTDDIPGGWCFAIYFPSADPERKVLIPVQRLPKWAGEPRPDDRRPLMAAVEMLVSDRLN